jgi:hypothetical protein
MAVQRYRLPLDAKNGRRLRMEGSVRHKLGDGGPTLKMRIDGDERFGSEAVAGVDFFYLLTNVRRSNLRERAGKTLVIADQRAIEVENVHEKYPPFAWCTQ